MRVAVSVAVLVLVAALGYPLWMVMNSPARQSARLTAEALRPGMSLGEVFRVTAERSTTGFDLGDEGGCEWPQAGALLGWAGRGPGGGHYLAQEGGTTIRGRAAVMAALDGPHASPFRCPEAARIFWREAIGDWSVALEFDGARLRRVGGVRWTAGG